jgi:hypothetical protein
MTLGGGYIIDYISLFAGPSDLAGAAPMAAKKLTEKDYDDIPGTYVFDATARGRAITSTCSACR